MHITGLLTPLPGNCDGTDITGLTINQMFPAYTGHVGLFTPGKLDIVEAVALFIPSVSYGQEGCSKKMHRECACFATLTAVFRSSRVPCTHLQSASDSSSAARPGARWSPPRSELDSNPVQLSARSGSPFPRHPAMNAAPKSSSASCWLCARHLSQMLAASCSRHRAHGIRWWNSMNSRDPQRRPSRDV